MSKLSVPVSSEDHKQGREDAGCVLMEYGDYECPSCGEAYPIVKRLQKHFGERLLLVFRNFPLSQMHPHAESAAETAEFAASHDKFWEMHDLLYENQDRLEESLLVKLTGELHLAPAKLQDALENWRTKCLNRVFGQISMVESAVASMELPHSSLTVNAIMVRSISTL